MAPQLVLALRSLITFLLVPVLLFGLAMLVVAFTAQNAAHHPALFFPSLVVLFISGGMLWMAWRVGAHMLTRLLVSSLSAIYGVLSFFMGH